MLRNRNKKYTGFTLIEGMTFLFIFSVITITFYSVWSLGIRHINESKSRLGAASLAREKMEIIRNLAYDDIGVTGGIPSGDIPATEDISRSGKNYHVRTLVQFVDDEFDGEFPADAVWNDYKRVKVIVSWGDSPTSEVFLVSSFAPPGLEVGSGDGVLAINIVNKAGEGVPQADVHIVNNDVSPAVNISAETDDTGNLMFPGALESILGYRLTVSKSGYEEITTIHPDDAGYNHTDIHASVVIGALNPKTIIIDRLADLRINSIDQAGNAVPNVTFDINGGRILGTDSAIPPQNVYNLTESDSTGTDGGKNFADISPGDYEISAIGSVSGYSLVRVDPPSPVSVSPNEEKTVNIVFADESADSLKVTVLKNLDSSPVADANVRLFNGVDFDQTETTKSDGVAFFPDNGSLDPGDYTLEVSATGYQNFSGPVSVDNFTQQEIRLTEE